MTSPELSGVIVLDDETRAALADKHLDMVARSFLVPGREAIARARWVKWRAEKPPELMGELRRRIEAVKGEAQ